MNGKRPHRGRALNQSFQFAIIFVLLSAFFGVSPVDRTDARGEGPAPVQNTPSKAPLFAPVAAVTLGVPADVMVGEQFTFTATFANTSGTASDVGYGPFIDIVLPTNGADGLGSTNLPLDGISFVSATYLGIPVTATALTFPGTGPVNTCVSHPYAVAPTTGTPLQVCGPPGDTLVVLQLPFGSFVPGQPPVVVQITASLSDLADVGTTLNIRARGGYQYGATALSDWCCSPFDATILSHPSTNSTTWPASPTTPRLFTITKSYIGPENETATGPNFPRQYTVTVDIANGQTLTNLDVSDALHNNMQFVSFDGSSPASSAISTPSTVTPGGTLTRRFASITGGVTTSDTTVTFSFYIPRLDAASAVIINATTGAAVTSANNASAIASWTPVDPRDSATPVVGICTPPCHSLNDRSIATQKSVALVTDTSPTGISPGDTLEYTLNFQVSDFFAFQNVFLTDVLSDGQHLDLAFAPTMTYTGNPASDDFAVTMGAANIDVACNYSGAAVGPACDSIDPALDDGTTSIVFNVSDEVFSQAATNRLIGGCINPGTGSNPPNCGTYNDGSTQGAIVLRSVIQQNFTDDYPSGDPSVDHGDILGNDLDISGDVLNPTTSSFTPTGSIATDDSAAGVVVGFGVLTKSVYAVNGIVCDLPPGNPSCQTEISTTGLKPGDTLTYHLTYSQPASDFEETVLTDYLPLPIFVSTEVSAFSNTICGVPAAGNACLGPGDTFHTLTTPVPPAPTLSTNGTANTVIFTYADYDNTSDVTSLIDVLFTVTVTGAPFADGLFLTNQANVTEGTTNSVPTAQNDIIQIKINEPVLISKKGVVATDNPSATFSPTLSSPVFNAPGNAGARWAGTISSSGGNPVANIGNSDLDGVDAGDLVTFAIVIENSGRSINGAFDITIQDVLQAQYDIPSGGLNLRVSYGDPTQPALNFTDLGGGIFGSGIRIDDPNEGTTQVPGACQVHDATNGLNIIIITYDLQLDPFITVDQAIINTASLVNYASREGGPNFLATPGTDSASVQPVSMPTKSIVTTSEGHTSESGNGDTATPRLAAIGEIVRYRIQQRAPEGIVTNFRVHDSLGPGLTFLDDGTALMVFVSDGGGGVTSTTLGIGLDAVGDEITVAGIAPSFAFPDTAVSEADLVEDDSYASGDDVFFKLGDVNNTDRDIDNEFVVIEFNAIVANIAGNTNRDNTAAPRYGAATVDGTSSSVVRVRVVQPSITFTKTIVALPSPLDAGGVVQYRLSYANGTGATVSNAYEVHLTDTLPAQLTLNSVSVSLANGAAGITDVSAGNTVDVTIGLVPANAGAPAASVTIDYSAIINGTVTPAEIITNTSTATWTSLPGSGTSPNGTGSTAGAPGGASGERNGTGGVNNYTATRSRNFTIDSPTIIKQLTTTSASHTSGSDVAIGEEITYDIFLSFPEGATDYDTVVDNLPTGLVTVSGSSEVIDQTADTGSLLTADFNGTILAPTPTITEAAGSVTFEFDDVIVAADNVTTNNTIQLRFRARVTNVSTNQSGTTLTNSANNQVLGGPSANSNTVTATVVEPLITFGKTVVSVPSELDNGGVIHYRISYANGTGATVSTAMDVHITDALAGALLLPSTSAPDLVITPSSGAVGLITNNSTPSNIDILIASVPPGESVIVDFFPVIQIAIGPGEILANTGVSTWTSLSGPDTNERNGTGTNPPNDYTSSQTVNVTADVLQPVKSIISTSASHTSEAGDGSSNANARDLTIGEIIRYRLTVQIPEGTTTDLELEDTLPAGFTFQNDGQILISFLANSDMTEEAELVSADNDALPPTIALPATRIAVIGQAVTFTVGDLVNNDSDGDAEFVVIDFNVVVNNDANNNNTDLDSNNFELLLGGTSVATSNNVTTRIVESVLNISKTVSDPTPAQGQVLTFTLVISHTGASNATAFDVNIVDDLPAQLSLASAITISTSGTVINPLSSVSAGDVVQITADAIGLAGTMTVTFDATVLAPFGEPTFQNTAEVRWTSLPGPDSGERDGSQTPAYNDYRAQSQVDINVDRDLAKSLVASNVTTTSPLQITTIGEILTYQVVLTLPPGLTDTAIITDTLDEGLAFVDCAETEPLSNGMYGIVTGPSINISSTIPPLIFTPFGVGGDQIAGCNHGPDTAPPGTFNTVISNSGRTIRFDLGTIQNQNPNDSETITLTYRVIVLDIASNIQNQGVLLDNDVDWTWSTGEISTFATPSIEITEPQLQIEKTVDPDHAPLGSTVGFTIDIGHTPLSQTTAYDVIVTDGIPTGLELDELSVQVTSAGGLLGQTIVTTPTTLTVSWDEFPLGGTATITFDAVFVGPSPVFNAANVEWSTLEIDPVLGLSVQQSSYNSFSTERRYDPLDSTGINNYTASSTAILLVPPWLPGTGFAPGRITELPEQPADSAYRALGDLWLEIPELGVDTDIVGVPYGEENWNLTWLAGNAGYLEGTAYPTHAGNSGITAHAYLADGTPGPFANLDKLGYGDQIIVHLGGQQYIYAVREEKLVRPELVSAAFKHEDYPWLTLITCKTYSESTKDYVYRVVVRAILVDVIAE